MRGRDAQASITGVGHDQRAEDHQEHEDRDRQQQHLHQLHDHQHQDEVPAREAGHLGVRRGVAGRVLDQLAAGLARAACPRRRRAGTGRRRRRRRGRPPRAAAPARNAAPSTRNSSAVSHSAPAPRFEATCQTSVLMNRNVMNSSSSGSARVAIGSSVRRLPDGPGQRPGHDRPRPQRGEGVPGRRGQAEREQQRRGHGDLARDPRQQPAGPGGEQRHDQRPAAATRRGRSAARAARRSSGTK